MPFASKIAGLTLISALSLGLGSCKKDAPSGTTPPGEGGDASADADGKGKKKKKKGRKGKKGDGGGAGAEQAAAPQKACPAEVSETPTPLFGNSLFIRTPKNVEIVEDSPFFAKTMADFVSTCEAMIDRMFIFVRPDDPAGEDLKKIRDELMAQSGYTGGTWESPEKDEKDDLRVVGEFPAGQGAPAAKLYYVALRKYERIFIFVYQAQPDQWLGVYESFKESANRAIIPPPDVDLEG